MKLFLKTLNYIIYASLVIFGLIFGTFIAEVGTSVMPSWVVIAIAVVVGSLLLALMDRND